MYRYKAIITRIYDGDTITCDVDLGFEIWMRNQTFRLAGVDTPELRGKERPEGIMVRDWVRSELPIGCEVLIETEKNIARRTDKKGKYGRWIATIWRKDDPKSINKKLIIQGYEYK